MKLTNSTMQHQEKIQLEDLEGFEELSEVEASSLVGGGFFDGLLGGLSGGGVGNGGTPTTGTVALLPGLLGGLPGGL